MTSTMTTEGAEEFAGDVVLADDIAGFPAPDPQTVSEVFLTGATGFLGAFLLRDLLRQGLVVHCLVRGADTAAARDRLTANLRALELLDDVDLDRVRVYTGDVTKPRLGMAEDTYAGLARRVGAVYHSAAKVNFLTLYKWLRKSTVEATHGILRFACAARATLHHVSTTGVFEPGRTVRPGPSSIPPGRRRRCRWATPRASGSPSSWCWRRPAAGCR